MFTEKFKIKQQLVNICSKFKNPFFTVSLLLCISLCFFQLWLYWPGYIQDDSRTTLLLDKSGWHPVIMAYLVEIMHNLFGVHVYNLFLLTMVPFYLGIWIIIYSVYIKTKSWCSLLLIFPCLIGNIFYALIKMGSSSFSLSWGVLLYALTLYMILQPVPQKRSKTFYIFYGIVFIIALLGRQNAILQVWPVTFVWIGLYLAPKELSFGKYFGYFIPLSVLSGIISSILLIGGNSLLSHSDNGKVYPETLIVMHQIVATCAPEMDESCFNPDWWYGDWATDPNRMERLKTKYENFKQDAEVFSLSYEPDVTFKYFTNLEGRYSKLLYAIKKYPNNYWKHVHFFYIDLWQFPPFLVLPEALTEHYSKEGMINHIGIFHQISQRERENYWKIANQIPDNELSLKWTEKKLTIDKYIRENLLSFNMDKFVTACFALFFIGICLFLVKRQNLLNILFVSTTLGSALSWLIIPLFCPREFIRYVEPAIIYTLLSAGLLFIIIFEQIPVGLKYIKSKFKKDYQ